MSKENVSSKKAKNSTVFVNRSIKSEKFTDSVEDEDIIAVHEFVTEPARVTVDYSITMNLGNYESAKIGVSVQIPCYAEEIDEAFAFAQSWVTSRLEKEKSLVHGVKSARKNF